LNLSTRPKALKPVFSRQDAKAQRKVKPHIVSYAERAIQNLFARKRAKIGPWVSLRLCVLARCRLFIKIARVYLLLLQMQLEKWKIIEER
jgi:hypothetical protein